MNHIDQYTWKTNNYGKSILINIFIEKVCIKKNFILSNLSMSNLMLDIVTAGATSRSF